MHQRNGMRAGNNIRKGPWYEEEDERLKAFVAVSGERRWDSLARASGLRRSGKSCRLRWLNYLRPCLKHGPITPKEENLILHLHEKWGNKWADIARRLPGRTDNEIKNLWRSHSRRKMHIEDAISGETSCSSDQVNCSNSSTLKCNPKIEETSQVNDKGKSVKEVIGDKMGCQDYRITSLPYENQLSDWMSTLSREQSDISSELSGWDSTNEFGYLCDLSLTDCSEYHCIDSLWDVDLFN